MSRNQRTFLSISSGDGLDQRQIWEFSFEGKMEELLKLVAVENVEVYQNNETLTRYKVIFPSLVSKLDAENWIKKRGGELINQPNLFEQLFGSH